MVTWRFRGMSDQVAHSSLPKEPSSARDEEIMGGVIYSKNQVNINSSESPVQERQRRLWTWAAVEDSYMFIERGEDCTACCGS